MQKVNSPLKANGFILDFMTDFTMGTELCECHTPKLNSIQSAFATSTKEQMAWETKTLWNFESCPAGRRGKTVSAKTIQSQSAR
jgi:hypothetical protein